MNQDIGDGQYLMKTEFYKTLQDDAKEQLVINLSAGKILDLKDIFTKFNKKEFKTK